MSTRNPFTSISNLSFVRNTSKVTPQTKNTFRQSFSPSNKYFQCRKTYAFDNYLNQYDQNRQRETAYSRAVGLQALRYQPRNLIAQTTSQDYYNIDNYREQQNQNQNNYDIYPTCLIEEPLRQTAPKEFRQTKDMFSSDYFIDRMSERESVFKQSPYKESAFKQQASTVKKTAILLRKDTNSSTYSRLRFKQEVEIRQASQRMSEVQQQLQKSSVKNVKSNASCKELNPPTIYLKCKKKVFYLYGQIE